MDDALITRLPIGERDDRQGRYLQTVAYVWWCGDEVCDCSQVAVERLYENARDRRFVWIVRIAEGPFSTDGEQPAPGEIAEARVIAEADRP